MLTLRILPVSTILLCAFTAFHTLDARAEDSPTYARWRGRAVGLSAGDKSLPVLEVRSASKDGRSAADRIALSMRKLDPEIHLERVDTKTAQLRGSRWCVEVYEDGSAARGEALDKSEALVPREQRMPIDRLTRLGQDFVEANLVEQLGRSSSDELIAAYSYVHVVGGQSAKGGPAEEFVKSNTIVFRRMVSGVPVVGQGSRVEVTFSADGVPIGYEYDWPTVAPATNPMPTVPAEEHVSKLQRLMDKGQPSANLDLSALAAGREVKISNGFTVRELLCGYYDPGAEKRLDGKLQPGCEVDVMVGRTPMKFALPFLASPELTGWVAGLPRALGGMWQSTVEVPQANKKEGSP